MPPKPCRLAVLIDMDQEEPDMFGRVLDKAAAYGAVSVRRAYGNCDKLSKWEECLQYHDIKAVPNYADGSNAADLTMAIDAMDLLHTGTVDGFCVVSSDHIFAGLVRRLRSQGVFVAGIGRRRAHMSLREALGDMFTVIEDLGMPAARAYGEPECDLVDRVRAAVGKPGERALLSVVGERLDGVNYRAYCHGDLKSLLESYPEEFVLDGKFVKRLDLK